MVPPVGAVTVRAKLVGVRLNPTVTVGAEAGIVNEQVPVPEQVPPPQPAKVYPVFACAVNVTRVPEAILALQVPGQLIPLPVTVPPDGVPPMELVTERVTYEAARVMLGEINRKPNVRIKMENTKPANRLRFTIWPQQPLPNLQIFIDNF